MTFTELYAARKPVTSIEFFPPRTPETAAKFEANLPAFRALSPAFCSLTMGAGGNLFGNTVELVTRLKRDEGMEMVCHFTCVGKSRDEVREILGQLKAGGVEKIIALRGDPPKGETEWKPHPDGLKFSVELVREARAFGGFSIAVAGFPETHPDAASPEADLAYLKEKVDAGADAVITQLFFDNEDFLRFADRARKAGIHVPIVPGILPIRTVAWVRKFIPICKARIPAALEAELVKVEKDDAACQRMGTEYAIRQCRGLMAEGVAQFHLCSLNDPAPVSAIVRELGL